MSRAFGPRRAEWVEVTHPDPGPAGDGLIAELTRYDLVYRSLCSVLFNYAQSGHPGGSVSSGRFVAAALFGAMDYDIGDPNRRDADLLSYAAGHKALGLYAMLALRDEIVRIGDPAALPGRGPAPPPLRGPARLPPQPDAGHPPLPPLRVEGARRPPHPGHPLRQAGHRRLGSGLRRLPGPGPGGGRLLR